MVDPVETANEQIAEAHREHGESDPWPRRMAVTVSFLAAALALAEVGAKSSQTGYLTYHIGASDTWNFYQARNLRANVWESEASILESLPSGSDPAMRVYFTTAGLRLSAPLNAGIAPGRARSVHFRTRFEGSFFQHRGTAGTPCVAPTGKFFQAQPSAVSTSP